MKDLHQQYWVKSMNWENDPRLLPGFERLAARIGASVPNVREVFLASRKFHANHVGLRHLDKRAPAPTWSWLAEASGMSRRWAKAIYNAITDVGFLERDDGGWFRPNPALRDEAVAWETARRLLDTVPESDTSDRKPQSAKTVPPNVQTVPQSVHTVPPPAGGANVQRVPLGAPEAAPDAGFGRSREGPQKQHPPADRIEVEVEAATVTPPTSGRRTSQNPADPTKGPDPEGHNTHSGGDAPDDPALAQDGGPCADCGNLIGKALADSLRHLRRIGGAARWSHRQKTWGRCP